MACTPSTSITRAHPRPNLVILDLDMPVLTGEETQERLLVVDPSVRILFVSGHDEPARESAVHARGALGFSAQAVPGARAAWAPCRTRCRTCPGPGMSTKSARGRSEALALTTSASLVGHADGRSSRCVARNGDCDKSPLAELGRVRTLPMRSRAANASTSSKHVRITMDHRSVSLERGLQRTPHDDHQRAR